NLGGQIGRNLGRQIGRNLGRRIGRKPRPSATRELSVTHRFTMRKALASAGVLIVLAGCSSGGKSGGSTGATSGPVHGRNLVIARTADTQAMKAATGFDHEAISKFEQIYQTLYTVTNNGKNGKPWLATSYKVSPDKKTYTFTLRPGVKFSDGKAMTSADVKFSLDKTRAAAKGWGYIDSAIKSVAAP